MDVNQKVINLSHDYVKEVCQVILAAVFLGLFSKIYIPLFFTPIPLILQNSIAVTYGYFFKSKMSAASILLFILLGAIGFPFFSGGSFGLTHLVSVKGGYIFGYAIAGYIIGKLFEKSEKNISIKILLGHLVILLCGWMWFSLFIGIGKAFVLGFLPFIAGDIFKTIIITKLIRNEKNT